MTTNSVAVKQQELPASQVWKAKLWTLAQRLVSSNYRSVREILQQEAFVQPQQSYLDFGCGTGELFPLFRGTRYLGIDIDQGAIRYAQFRFGGEHFRVLDGRRIAELGQKFDNFFVMGVIHHLSNADASQALETLSHTLRPGGRALVIEIIPVLSQANWFGRLLRAVDQGRFIRTPDGYAGLLKKHFHIEKAYTASRYPLDYAVFLLRQQNSARATTE